jgi:hypothetical protein
VAVRYFCDRCGGEVGKDDLGRVMFYVQGKPVAIRSPVKGVDGQVSDICEPCTKEVVGLVRAFMAGTPVVDGVSDETGRAVKVQHKGEPK